tara:strand:+ start:88 stop:477 length:390 start_codon:yes stop_codon:yes gene_type:complete
MFEAHIQYYAYNNIDDDDFGVGYLGNKQDWVERINRWNWNDGFDERFTVEDWDDLDCQHDFRGCELAEIEPDSDAMLVTWQKSNHSFVIKIEKNGDMKWLENPRSLTTFPRWINRMKTMLREAEKAQNS